MSLVRHRNRFRRRRSYLGHDENSAGTLSACRDRACCWTISWAADTELWGLLCQRVCPAGVCSHETGSVRPHCAQISDWPCSWFSCRIPGPHLVGTQLTSAGCLPPTLLVPTGHTDIPVTHAHGAFCTNAHCAHGSMSVSWVTVTNAWLRPATVSALKGVQTWRTASALRRQRGNRSMLTARRVQEAPTAPRGTSHGAWLWALAKPMLYEACGDVRRGRAQVCI